MARKQRKTTSSDRKSAEGQAPSPRSADSTHEPSQSEAEHHSAGSRFRELADELVFVFVIVMFVKMFLVELYKIPTGSMTPTLLGGLVAIHDLDADGAEDVAFWGEGQLGLPPLVYYRRDDFYEAAGKVPLPSGQAQRLYERGEIDVYNDKILVNKLPYWFGLPRRGEVVVFKVPPFMYDLQPEAPIYIKRMIGEPGDALSFEPDPDSAEWPSGKPVKGWLAVNGERVTDPPFFRNQRYRFIINRNAPGYRPLPFVDYSDINGAERKIERVRVPEDRVWMMGDNADGSLDSRYWGGVDFNHLKGRAFVKVWPLSRIGWID